MGRVGAGTGVTASVGVTEVRPGDEGHEVLGRADQGMYRAGAAGGNQVTALARLIAGRSVQVLYTGLRYTA